MESSDCDSCKTPGANVKCSTCPRIYHQYCFVQGLDDSQIEHRKCLKCNKYGTKAIQVVEFEKITDTDGKKKVIPRLQIDKIKKIIRDSNAEDLPVFIVSVAGVARSGKSFLLSLLIDRNIHQLEKGDEKWIDSKGHITGFSWAQSSTAVTFGMMMWEKAFITKLKDGTEVAIIYMDTQGTGDRVESTNAMTDTQIMYLSLEISALQIHNINSLWRVEDTRIYEVCKLYGERLTTGEHGEKPFNSLVILYRNWQTDRKYGFRRNHFQKELSDVSSSAEAVATLKGIDATFNSVEFAMLPHPGEDVVFATKTITKQEINMKFLTSAESFFELIYSSPDGYQEYMKKCKKGKVVIKLLEELKERLDRDDLPPIGSPAEHLSDTLNSQAHMKGLKHFDTNLDAIKESNTGSGNPMEDIETLLNNLVMEAVEVFEREVGKTSKSNQSYKFYRDKLQNDLAQKKEQVIGIINLRIMENTLKNERLKNALKTEVDKSMESWENQVAELDMSCELPKYKADMEAISKETVTQFDNKAKELSSGNSYITWVDDLQTRINGKETERMNRAKDNHENKRLEQELKDKEAQREKERLEQEKQQEQRRKQQEEEYQKQLKEMASKKESERKEMEERLKEQMRKQQEEERAFQEKVKAMEAKKEAEMREQRERLEKKMADEAKAYQEKLQREAEERRKQQEHQEAEARRLKAEALAAENRRKEIERKASEQPARATIASSGRSWWNPLNLLPRWLTG